MKKFLFSKVISGILVILLIILFVLTKIAGDAKIHGFDVDSEGRVYVGRAHQIEIYQGKELVDVISVPDFRNWSFKLSESGRFCVSDISTVYEIDESGQIISECEDVQSRAYKEMYKRKTVNLGEIQIHKAAPFGWTRIVNNDGDCLYKIPALNYWFMLASRIVSGMFFVSMVVFSIQAYKHRSKNKA